jgi:uncharacterized membrane protein YeaQ/YmgE (transglycosylase-associated protein family)
MLPFIGLMLLGVVVAVVVELLVPGRTRFGSVWTVLLGIVGALAGGYSGLPAGLYGPERGAGISMALLAATILISVFRMIETRASLTADSGISRNENPRTSAEPSAK